jgi:hypothetical protein
MKIIKYISSSGKSICHVPESAVMVNENDVDEHGLINLPPETVQFFIEALRTEGYHKPNGQNSGIAAPQKGEQPWPMFIMFGSMCADFYPEKLALSFLKKNIDIMNNVGWQNFPGMVCNFPRIKGKPAWRRVGDPSRPV